MDLIAAEANVHRTTVYKYFPNKDAIIAGVVFWENEGVVSDAKRKMAEDGSFVEHFVQAFSSILDNIKQSTALSLLLKPDSSEQFVRITAASSELRTLVTESFIPAIVRAKSAGELRNDLGVQEIADWVSRISLLLIVESFRDESLDQVDTLRRLILPGISRNTSPA